MLVAIGSAVGAHRAPAQPAVGEIEIGGASYSLDVARHHGYDVVRWSQVPGSVVVGSFQRAGTATGSIHGVAIELRAGSPFARHGDA
ncbi:MAG: hypothetical protein M8866_03395, partial [marine benthic group bacterium]|nr:hypothetical protein [Candidatus Benthicola marisminoris]